MGEYSEYDFAMDIIDSLPGFVAVDAEGKVVFIRDELAKVLGTEKSQAIGKPINELVINSNLPDFICEDKKEWGIYRRHQSAITGEYLNPALYNRIHVKRRGNPDQVAGAVEYIAVSRYQDDRSFIAELEYLRQQNEMYRKHISELYKPDLLDDLLGSSAQVKELKRLILNIADTVASVCIYGETGTGKELVASAIHKLSRRSTGPFVKINCAAIPKNLMESELFGYESGAFTGAARQGKIGMFELANGGTLLLDEIGELPLDLQSKLLRVLQEQEITRVGGVKPIPIDVRIVCSTNRNLQQMANAGQFRTDLYYRINTLEVTVPPLRERIEDIGVLAEHFIRAANKKNGLAIYGISAEVSQILSAYHWPGNVRELEHCIERACILCGAGLLTGKHFNLPQVLDHVPTADTDFEKEMPQKVFVSYRSKWDKEDADKILRALDAASGNRGKAAEILQISQATLYRKIKKYNLSEII